MDPDETPVATEAPPDEMMSAPEEAVDAALAEAPAEEVDSTLEVMDAVFAKNADDAPAWMQPLLADLEKSGDENFKVSRDVLKDAPIEVQQMIANYRNMALRRSDETARESKTLEGLREQLRVRGIEQDERDARTWALFQSQELKEKIKPPEGEQPNYIEDPAGWAKYEVQMLNSKWADEFLGTIGTVGDDFKARAVAAREEKRISDERVVLKAFVEEHPDLMHEDHIDEIDSVSRALSAREGVPPGAGHTIRAYNMVMFEKGLIKAPQVNRAEEARDAMRTNGRTTKKQLPATPGGLEGMQLHDWYDQHPGTMERDVEALRRRGTSF